MMEKSRMRVINPNNRIKLPATFTPFASNVVVLIVQFLPLKAWLGKFPVQMLSLSLFQRDCLRLQQLVQQRDKPKDKEGNH
ncbi:MAG: hypothetical protein Ct9H300mP21_10500 [Pseudomonadota bacterium]|nr:MAG: hypothetical protein Ct9H300mP21_10500 [Pseudomonadota bacterium]